MSVSQTKQTKLKTKGKRIKKCDVKTQNGTNVNRTILDNFYSLVHSQSNIRLTAACSTYKILNVMRNKSDLFNDNLNYCIERLVAGLASNRAQARRGYGTLLLEILNTYSISTERLFAVAENKFVGHISNDTTRDNLLGYFLLLSVILESGNYKKSKANSQQIEKIYRFLIQLHNAKSYFEYPVSKLLCQYQEALYQCMLADVPPQAFGSDAKISSVQLLTILLCNKIEPVRELNKLDSSGLINLCSILQDDKFKRRPLHPVFHELTDFVAHKMPQHLELIYSHIMKPIFFKANHNELAAMGLEYTAEALKSIKHIDAVKVLLNEHIIRLLVLSTKNNTALKVHVVHFFKSISEQFASQNTDEFDTKQYAIIHRLTSLFFYEQDYMKTLLKNLLNNCTSSVLKKHLEVVMKHNNKSRIRSTTEQIAFIIHRPQLIDATETTKLVLQFLVSNLGSSEDDVRSYILCAFHATLEHIVSGSHLSSRVDLLKSAIELCNECTSEPSELWFFFNTNLDAHLKLVEKNSDCKELLPVTTLFLFYGLQIFEHQFECKDQLEELNQCASDIIGGRDGGSAWADVLTDQIIALLSSTECKPWIRKLCEKVFRSLVPYISATSVNLLCEAIKAPLDSCTSDEDESLSDDDKESYEDKPGDNDEAGDVTDDEDGEKEEKHDKLDIDVDKKSNNELGSGDENDMSVDETFELTDIPIEDREVKNAIDESEEEYLDDEQMMKLDSVIANMFKLNQKKRPNPSFKLRCLDLIKILLQKHTDTTLISLILATIIPLYTSSRKFSETRPISDKILIMLSKMSGKGKYPQLVDFLAKQQAKKSSRAKKNSSNN